MKQCSSVFTVTLSGLNFLNFSQLSWMASKVVAVGDLCAGKQCMMHVFCEDENRRELSHITFGNEVAEFQVD